MDGYFRFAIMFALLCLAPGSTQDANAQAPFRIATYNVENYLLAPLNGRPEKSRASRAKVAETLVSMDADIVALQEIGGSPALDDLRDRLAKSGRPYPHFEIATGHDTNISVAVISRFPILARRTKTRLSYVLLGRRRFVNRPFVEIDLQPAPGYRLTLIAAHLKSQREVLNGDEAEIREQEAGLLRQLADARLKSNPKLNLVVLGDFNDNQDTRSIRTLIGRGNLALIDTRPAEHPLPFAATDRVGREVRSVTWTHHYAKEDTYSRLDYLLISRGLYHEWIREQSFVASIPDWGNASDHRPVVATFIPNDTGTRE